MEKQYICYCGLYCELCPVKAKITPAAKRLLDEMNAMGCGEWIKFYPDGDGFWRFLNTLSETGLCDSCQNGSGDPDCAIRICAKEKNVEACPQCSSYPCDKFDRLFEHADYLKADNALLRDKGMDAWAKLMDERTASGYTYADDQTQPTN